MSRRHLQSSRAILFAPPVFLIALAGCATVDPSADYAAARGMAADNAAFDQQLLHVPEEDARTIEEVASRIEGGVTIEEAVEIALLNNKGLQADFYTIGVSRADLVQAGLLANPSLGAVLRFPRGDGDATLEARLAWNLLDLWHRPARKRVQERRLEQTVLQVAHSAALLAARTREAYIKAVAAQGAHGVEEENHTSTREFLELTLARQQAGASTDTETNSARAEHLEQGVRLRSARLQELEKKSRLASLLGLSVPPDELVLSSTLSLPPELSLDLETLMTSAASHRLDLWAAKENMLSLEQEVTLQKRLFMPNLLGAVSIESRGEELEIGPGIGLDVPLFDQNRAQVSKAELRYQQAEKALAALTISTRQEVRIALERLLASIETANAYRQHIAPLRESNLELARESFAAGKTGFLSVLEAQKQLLIVRRDANSWAEASALMVTALEATCGRPLSELLEERDAH